MLLFVRANYTTGLSGICTERTTFLGRTDFLGCTVARRYFVVRDDTLSISTDNSVVQSATLQVDRIRPVTTLRNDLRNILEYGLTSSLSVR